MPKQKVPLDHSEHDEVLTRFLDTHHVRAKDVRAYAIDRRHGELGLMTLEIFMSGVDEIPPPVLLPGRDMTEAEVDELKKRFMEASRRGSAETQIISPPPDWSEEKTEAFKKVYTETQRMREARPKMPYEGPNRHDPEAGR